MKPNTTIHFYRCADCYTQWPQYDLEVSPIRCIRCQKEKASRIFTSITDSYGHMKELKSRGEFSYIRKTSIKKRLIEIAMLITLGIFFSLGLLLAF